MTSPTTRQLEVLAAHVAAGTYKGAGELLGISPRTVRSHLVSLRLRLGVDTTTQAVFVVAMWGGGWRGAVQQFIRQERSKKARVA